MARDIWTLQIQVDRAILKDFQRFSDKKIEDFTHEDVQNMEGLANELCTKLESFGYVRMQSILNEEN